MEIVVGVEGISSLAGLKEKLFFQSTHELRRRQTGRNLSIKRPGLKN
jgi:hypothetical protein